MIIWHATPLDFGEVANSMLPKEAIMVAFEKVDAWVKFDHLIYSTPYYIAMKK